MDTLVQVQNRHIHLMQTTALTLGHIVGKLNEQDACTWRDQNDAPKGWTVLEVLCHIRDFDGFFRHRAEMMLRKDKPRLPAYDHEALALEHAYNQQNLARVFDELQSSRRETVAFFEALDEAGWQKTGIHPERGPFSMLDAVMQVGLHDIMHLEQITRIIADARP